MSAGKEEKSQAASETTQEVGGLLNQIIDAMPQTTRDRGEELMEAFVGEALKGAVTRDKSVTRAIQKRIDVLDGKISKQLAAIMHAENFQKMEGTWRGLHHLVINSETGEQLRIKMCNVTKRELFKDVDKATEFDQSTIFKKLYETEFGMPGGQPYGALIGDYEFSNHPEDVDLLSKMSSVAAAAFCPFISAASPRLLKLNSYTDLPQQRDLAKIFLDDEYTQWRSFRDSDDSRFAALVMPRVLSRLPYGKNTKTVDEFNFEEVELGKDGRAKPVPHEHYAWMNASYVYGAKLTDAFAKTGFCVAIRGVENGGKVEDLPAHIFTSDDGDTDMQCPTEVGITDRREHELSNLGFLSLCHFKNTDYSVFIGGQTNQKPKKYNTADATENAAISARLPYIMASSRIAHFLKVIARDKIGSFKERSDMQDFLETWIAQYVCADPNPTDHQKAEYPLAEARIEVTEIPGEPGAYNAVCHLRSWLQLEKLTASLRMVARLPKKA